MPGPTGGTITITIGNGVSDRLPHNATAAEINAALAQAVERNTLK